MSESTFPCRQIGDLSVTAISDGYLTASLEFLSNIEVDEAERIQAGAGVKEAAAIHINCYLVRGRGRTVLIDSGAGGFKQWGGLLKGNLVRAGVDPSEIDAVLLTHAHPDHIGGLIDASGKAVFTNAEVVVNHHEVLFWQDDENLARASERARGNFLIARNVFQEYRDHIRTFESGDVLPGVGTMSIPGHTSGHTGFRIDDGRESLLIWGDVVHFPHIQVANPNVSIAFDLDQSVAAETRARILDVASSEKFLVAGMHLGEHGFARIGRDKETYSISYESAELREAV